MDARSLQFVPRCAPEEDFLHSGLTFIADGAWHNNGLDLSSIVPDGATAVQLQVELSDTNADRLMWIRQNDVCQLNSITCGVMGWFDGLTYTNRLSEFVAIDEDRKLDYWLPNVVFGGNAIRVTVLGWMI